MKILRFKTITYLLTVVFCLFFAVKSENIPKLKCDNNGNFTILIVSDPQCDTQEQWCEARDELETLVNKAQPDFVLINGDINSYNDIPSDMWDLFVSPLNSKNIYWSTTNGNHDPFDMKYYRMYKGYELCLNDVVDTRDINYDSQRPMNYMLPIYSSTGEKVVFAIYGMDSGTKTDGIYDGLTKRQIEWYKQQSQKLKNRNEGKEVVSMLCMHIPLPQMLEMYYDGKHSIYGVANEIKYNLNGYVCENGNSVEKINVHTSNAKKDNGMFDAILECGDIKAVLFGHNHRNNFIGSYKGVLLGFVGKLSTGCYSDTLCRGGRVVRFNQSNPQAFTTEWITSLETGVDQPPIFADGTLAK